MKQQLAALQRKVDQQTVISDAMIRKAISRGVDKLQGMGIVSVSICVSAGILLVALVYFMGLSKALVAATAVLFGVNAYWAYVIKVKKNEVSVDEPLVDTAKRMLKFKKDNRVSLAVLMPFAVIWAIWFIYEYGSRFGMEGDDFLYLGLSGFIGGVIGFIIGYFSFFRPSMRAADEVLDQIDELTRED